jgi:hypothetical protein
MEIILHNKIQNQLRLMEMKMVGEVEFFLMKLETGFDTLGEARRAQESGYINFGQSANKAFQKFAYKTTSS